MPTAQEIAILVRAQNQASAEFQRISGDLARLENSARSASGGLTSFGGALGGIVGGAARLASGFGLASFGVQQLAGAVHGAESALFSYDASMEQTRVAFTGLLGGASAAKSEMAALQQFAAATPLEMPQLVTAAQRLIGVGTAAQDVVPDITAIGDAVYAMGGGATEIDRATLALTQMLSTGKIGAQDMLQLAQLNIPAWQLLAQATGKSVAELQNLSMQGNLTASTYVPQLIAGMEERFKGQMEAASHTFNGLLSSVEDNLQQALGRVAEPALEDAEDELKRFLDYTNSSDFDQKTKAWADDMKRAADAAATFLREDGPQIASDLENAATGAAHLAANMATVAGKVADVAANLSNPQMQALLAGGAGLLLAGPEGAAVGVGAGMLAGQVSQDQSQHPGRSLGASAAKAATSLVPQFQGNPEDVAKGVQKLTDAYRELHSEFDAMAASAASGNKTLEERTGLTKEQIAALTQYVQTLGQVADATQQAAAMDHLRQVNAESAVEGLDQISASLYAQIQADTAAAQATDAVQASLAGLHATYEDGLGLIKVYNQANSEYQTQETAISDAVDIIQQKQKDGIPLTSQEIDLLNDKDALIGRLTGGMKDNTEQAGMAAAANVELMTAQDTLNGLLRDGITSGKDYDAAVQGVQSATDKAKRYGLDPATDAAGQFNQGLATLQGAIVGTLVPAIQTLAQDLANLKAPPPIEIQIATGMAMQQLNDLKAAIREGAVLPVSISPGTFGSTSAGSTQGNAYAAGTGPGGVPHTMLARVGELGPELAIYPYAGSFAAGGTVGLLGNGYALLPKGTDIIPADKTAELTNASSIFSAMAETLGGDTQRIPEFLAKIEGYVKQYGAAILQDWVDLASQLQGQIDEAWAKGDGEQQAKLQSELAGVQQLMTAFASDTGQSMSAAIADAAASKDSQQYITDAWSNTLDNFSDILTGRYQQQIQDDLTTTQRELALLGDQLPPEIAAKLKQHAADDAADLEAAGKIMSDAIAKGAIENPALTAIGQQTADVIQRVLGNPSAVKDYQDAAKQAYEAHEIALREGLPPSVTNALHDAANAALQQAQEAGQAVADATALGYIQSAPALTDAQLAQLDAAAKQAKDGGASLVDGWVQAIEDGRVDAATAMKHLTGPQIDALKALEQEWTVKYAQAILDGTDPSQAAENLKVIDGLLDQTASKISKVVDAAGNVIEHNGDGSTSFYNQNVADQANQDAATAAAQMVTAAAADLAASVQDLIKGSGSTRLTYAQFVAPGGGPGGSDLISAHARAVANEAASEGYLSQNDLAAIQANFANQQAFITKTKSRIASEAFGGDLDAALRETQFLYPGLSDQAAVQSLRALVTQPQLPAGLGGFGQPMGFNTRGLERATQQQTALLGRKLDLLAQRLASIDRNTAALKQPAAAGPSDTRAYAHLLG